MEELGTPAESRVSTNAEGAGANVEERWEILLDYPVKPYPRYGYGRPYHSKLYEIINRNRPGYAKALTQFLKYREYLLDIPVGDPGASKEPSWACGWITGVDLVTLYALTCELKPAHYAEIGSGCSTKFVRRAIRDHGLHTRIVSVDPNPRDEIDSICDLVVRQPLEDADLSVFDNLEAGDVLFMDGSHRCLMNSDTTVMFLDVLPRLKPGVFVGFHDIYLPCDYPPGWEDRFYSEQYLLAAYLLAEGRRSDIFLANWFISSDPDLSSILSPLWNYPRMDGLEKRGSAFWLTTR